MIKTNVLNMIVNVWDPLDVMIHAPLDEYSLFVSKLKDMLLKTDFSVEAIAHCLSTLYDREFGIHDKYDDKIFRIVAELIYNCADQE